MRSSLLRKNISRHVKNLTQYPEYPYGNLKAVARKSLAHVARERGTYFGDQAYPHQENRRHLDLWESFFIPGPWTVVRSKLH